MSQYTKLFASIVTSTIWTEDDKTRIVWITMLAIANKNGEVEGSVPGLARVAGVGVDDCRIAIGKFLSPDPDSRTKDDEGRRIEEIDGGWSLLNHRKYREMASKDEQREAEAKRKARYRDKLKRNGLSQNVPDMSHEVPKSKHIAEAEAEAEAEKTLLNTPPLPPKGEPKPLCTMEQAKSHAPTNGLTDQEAEYWWHSRNSAGWTKATANGGHPRRITSWQSDMASSVEWIRSSAAKNTNQKQKWKPNL